MRLAVLLVALAVVYFFTRDEKYQEETFSEIKAQVSPDENGDMIFQTQQELVKIFKVCCHCVGTNKIQMFKDSQSGTTKHVARYMFMIMAAFPYGLAVDATFVNNKLQGVSSQAVEGDTGDIVPFKDTEDFMKYDQMAEKPSLIQLDDKSK